MQKKNVFFKFTKVLYECKQSSLIHYGPKLTENVNVEAFA